VSLPLQSSGHATAVGLGLDTLHDITGPDYHLRVRLPLALGTDSEPEPDLAFVRGVIRDYVDGHPEHAVLVVEVSDVTLAFDRGRKASVYARAGIPELWIVNLQMQILEVYHDPAEEPDAPLGYAYRQRLSYGPDDRVSLLMIPGVEIVVRDLLP
jgi:Uma2 family endonuclease